MFCPKCGTEPGEGQRFCKSCGTNLQVVSDALEGGDDTLAKLRIDMDALTKKAVDWASGLKAGIGGEYRGFGGRDRARHSGREIRDNIRNQIHNGIEHQRAERKMPKPREWLRYSWQHNLRDGLISLFSGTGLGIFLYYIARAAIDAGTIRNIEEQSRGHVVGLEQLVLWLWLIALIPILKGIGQIIYAAFFGESLATLTERFMPKPVERITEPQLRMDQPQIQPERSHMRVDPSASATNELFQNPPPSVTEHTTYSLDEIPVDGPPRKPGSAAEV
jgi:hypothetical protein